MLYPCCPTCGTLLADKQIPYETELNKIISNKKLSDEEKSKERSKLLDSLQIINYCCRMRTISFISLEKIMAENMLYNV